MYDFWFTLGTVVTRPVFLDRVLKHAKPNFKRITRTIVETDPSLSEPPRTTATVNEISAGLLGIEGTRLAFAAPTVSPLPAVSIPTI